MIVCSCRVLTDRDFVGTLSSEKPDCPRSAVQAYRCLGCSPECGRCLRMVNRILAEARANHTCGDCVQPCAIRAVANGHVDHHAEVAA
jgi:bacterioferritin-associated ferredoxin